MKARRLPLALSLLGLLGLWAVLAAQTEPVSNETGGAAGAPIDPLEDSLASAVSPLRSAADGSILPRRDARTIHLRIPAPRGQIVDRHGEPLAQNRVAYQVSLQYRQFEAADRDFVVRWARTRLESLEGLVPQLLPKTDEELHDHYRHRRWLPLMVTGQIDEAAARDLESKLTPGLVLSPVYRRHYPHGDLAAHIIGYTGRVGRLPTGPINFNEPLWEESEGRTGFELLFNEQLTGEPATLRMIFDEDGRELLRNQVGRPRPGGTLVTTLDLNWQKRAEEVLRNGTRRGAFVVVDVITGEVLVMASRPTFDLNRFIPGISSEEYEALENDPANPLFGRAFQAEYPPASSFKPVVALAALNNGVIHERTTIYSGASLTIGNTVMRNWSSTPEGSIDVRRALARSTNTWFYQVGIQAGPDSFLNLSRKLGLGQTSGLPLVGERPGLVPDDAYMQRIHRRRILNGDTANMSIGQGDLLTTPLQVAQMMAGIGNGGVLPQLQLVRQVQDRHGRVVRAMQPERRQALDLSPEALRVVREGMRDVVSSGYGTGRSAGLSFTTLAGKTGTAQWGLTRLNQNLAWFAGFLPHDNPRYAFAVVYEGRPGERVSGGQMAAPMVRNFFEPLKDEIRDVIAPPARALAVVEGEGGAAAALPVEDGLPALPVEDGLPAADPLDEGVLRALPVNEDELDLPPDWVDDGLEEP